MSEASGTPRAMLRDVAGGEARELTSLEGATFPAAADPLGTHALIVRSVEDPHAETLWLVPLDGGEPLQLGDPAQAVRNPAWAPDGSFIVYESNHESFRDLYRVGRNGEGPARLTDAPHGSFEPAVGPDGRIAFVSSRDGDAELYVMGPKGSGQTRLTSIPGDDMKPAWTPDGTGLTWLARRGALVETWRMDADGANARRFREKPVDQQLALAQAWSPDGQRLAVTVQFGPTDIALDVLDARGAVLARVDGPGPDEHPSWSPDSQWLLFTGRAPDAGEPDLFRVDRDGGHRSPVTTDPAADWLGRWLPDPGAR